MRNFAATAARTSKAHNFCPAGANPAACAAARAAPAGNACDP